MMLYIKFSPHSNLKISHQGAILVRISRFHTPDFFFSNVGFHVVANLDFSLSPPCAFPPPHQIPAPGFPCFSARFQPKIVGDFAVFRPISTPGFVGWWQRWMDPAITTSSCPHYSTHHSHLLLHQHNVGGKKHIVLRSGKYKRIHLENTTVLLVWKLFFCPSQPSPRTDRPTLPKEFNTPRISHSHSPNKTLTIKRAHFQGIPRDLFSLVYVEVIN